MRLFARVGATFTLSTALAASVIGVLPGAAGAAAPSDAGRTFSVLSTEGTAVEAVVSAVEAAGGQVQTSNSTIGLLTVTARAADFRARLSRSPAVDLVAPVTVIGRVPELLPTPLPDSLPEALAQASVARAGGGAGGGPRPVGPSADPLDPHLWGLTAINAAAARKVEPGDKRVLVGILDTGVDGTHPDIAPNFSQALSRNFTTDIPTDPFGQELDGPCEVASCKDPADADDDGHGTHVAGSIAAAANSRGISGVAPGVTIVNVRGGQDSGLFFLQPVVDAITYAGQIGIDVLNMSFYVDPWLANCPANLADAPDRQAEQQMTIAAIGRAMEFAHAKGVSQLVAYGNSGRDPEQPFVDTTSPNYPRGMAYPRLTDPSCKDLPRQGPHAMTVGSYGPSGAKAGYSNFGLGMTVSAPGGWLEDYAGTPQFGENQNGVLSAYPRALALINGDIDVGGNITGQGELRSVLRDCKGDVCGYYQYLQGTSMATPHAAGVAALIVSAYGKAAGGGFGLSPDRVRQVLETTARDTACPDPLVALSTYGSACAGDPAFNTFFGHGSVDALAAVTDGEALLAPSG